MSRKEKEYLFIFSYLATVVAEKESKIREEMRMMGLLPGVDHFAYFTTVMIFATIPTLVSFLFEI